MDRYSKTVSHRLPQQCAKTFLLLPDEYYDGENDWNSNDDVAADDDGDEVEHDNDDDCDKEDGNEYGDFKTYPSIASLLRLSSPPLALSSGK